MNGGRRPNEGKARQANYRYVLPMFFFKYWSELQRKSELNDVKLVCK